MKKISERLKILRKIEKYTQRDLAEIMECGYSTIGHYEAGRVEPTIGVIEKLGKKHPEYRFWLISGEVDPPKHISPDIAKIYKVDSDAGVGVKVLIKE